MEQELKVSVGQKADLLRVLFFTRLARVHINNLITKNPDVSDSLKNGTFRVNREINILEKKVLNATDDQFPWLREELDKTKVWDIGAIADLIIRIGSEEKESVYEEFLGMVIEAMNSIYYAQGKRKHLYFGKYRALFKVFTDEVIADSNNQIGQVMFKNGEIYLKASQLEHKEE